MSAPRRALIVVDVQRDYFEGPVSIQYPPVEHSFANILRAIDVASRNGLPIAIVQHSEAPEAPIFAPGTPGWTLHPELEQILDPSWKRIEKHRPSVFFGTDLEEWLRRQGADTVTIVGYMTNNCDQATANHAVNLGFGVEFLTDATGAIALENEAGRIDAQQLHHAVAVLLQSNYAAVVSTDAWIAALTSGAELARSNILVSTLRARGELPVIAHG